MALRIHRSRPRPDDFLVRTRIGRHRGKLFRHRASGDGHAIPAQNAVIEHDPQNLRHAAGGVKVGRHEPAGGLELAQHGDALANALEIIDGPGDAGGGRDREIMQHRVRRATGRHDERDRVFDGVAGDDVPRFEVVLDRVHQRPRGRSGRIRLLRIRGGHLRAAEKAHAERFERRGHRIRGVLTAAGATSGTRSSRYPRNPLCSSCRR